MDFKQEIILASKSPRRRELIQSLGFPHRSVSIEVDESFPATMPCEEVAEFLSRKKAQAFTESIPRGSVLLTADTVVIANGKVLGKPENKAEAMAMIEALSGNWHEVVTGVCLRTKEGYESFSVRTQVKFYSLETEWIKHYIDTYKPYDKAGAYGIQEWIGQIGVEEIKGCFYNVVGLPLPALAQKLLHENHR